MLHRFLYALYGLVLSLLFGIIFSAQVLGFLRLYTTIPAILMTLVISSLAGWAFFRLDGGYARQLAEKAPPDTRTSGIVGICMLLIVLLVYVVRMVLWPYSELGEQIHIDVITYHLPKAIELFRTGSMWTFEIPFGQYPVGYESLPAFSLILRGDYFGMGIGHALVTLYLLLAIYLLLRRYTSLPTGWLLLLTVGISFVPLLYSQIVHVGKTDTLLAATIVAAIAHVPLTPDRADRSWHPYALAFSTMISLSVKANGLFALVGIWLIVGWRWWRAYRQGQGRQVITLPKLIMLTAIMAPCGLWVVRNLIVMGRPYSPEISGLFSTTWLANLTNPTLYTDGIESVGIILTSIIALVTVLAPLFLKRIHTEYAFLLAIFWFGILITPLGVFHTLVLYPVRVEYRYMLNTWLLIYVLLIVLAEPFLQKVLDWLNSVPWRAYVTQLAAVAGTVALLLLLGVTSFFIPNEDNLTVLHTPAYAAPGVDGYASVYDYVQREIHNAVLYYDDYNPFYAYDAAYTNHPINNIYPLGMTGLLDLPQPDCIYHRNYAERSSSAPEVSSDPEWRLLYDDGVGRVYCTLDYIARSLPADVEGGE